MMPVNWDGRHSQADSSAYAANAKLLLSAFIFSFHVDDAVTESADGFPNFNIPVETSTSPKLFYFTIVYYNCQVLLNTRSKLS